MGESSHWLGAPWKNATGSVGSSSVCWTEGVGATGTYGSARKSAGTSRRTVSSVTCAAGHSTESSRKVANVVEVEDSNSTSGRIEATAASVSPSQTVGGADICGATMARAVAELKPPPPEVTLGGSPPVSEELAGAGVMANSSSRTGGSLFPTSASENKLRVGRPSGVEATVGGWTAVASRGVGGRTFPTSESAVWGQGLAARPSTESSSGKGWLNWAGGPMGCPKYQALPTGRGQLNPWGQRPGPGPGPHNHYW